MPFIAGLLKQQQILEIRTIVVEGGLILVQVVLSAAFNTVGSCKD